MKNMKNGNEAVGTEHLTALQRVRKVARIRWVIMTTRKDTTLIGEMLQNVNDKIVDQMIWVPISKILLKSYR